MGSKIYIYSFGGLGDVVLSTAVFKTLKLQFPASKIVVLCRSRKHIQIYLNNPHIHKLVLLRSVLRIRYVELFYRMLAKLKKTKCHNLNYAILCPSLLYRKPAVELMASTIDLNLKVSDYKLQLFLTKAEEDWAEKTMKGYKNPIIMHVTAACSKNKMWFNENWEELIESMPEYTFIQLGAGNEVEIKGAIDMRGKTNIREAIALIKYSKSFVGVDSFASHVTNAFGVKGVVLFGPTSPSIWGHYNNINIYKGLYCSPCLDLIFSSECPFDKPCMKNVSVNEVKEALLLQLTDI